MPTRLRPRKIAVKKTDTDDNSSTSGIDDTSESESSAEQESSFSSSSTGSLDESDLLRAVKLSRKKLKKQSTEGKIVLSDDEDSTAKLKVQPIAYSCEKFMASKNQSPEKWNEDMKNFRNTSHMIDGSVLKKLRPTYFNLNDSNKDDYVQKYLVKWNQLSYIHCSWECLSDLKNLSDRGSKYWDKKVVQLEEASENDLIKCTEVQRVLSIKPNKIFIKWINLGYDSCSFELMDDVLLYNEESALQECIRFYETKVRVKPKKNLKTYSSARAFKHNNKLRSYQIKGVEWLTFNLIQGRNSILADEMGLGKTLQAICFMHRLCFSLKIFPRFLVIAPLATLDNWFREVELWTDFYAVVFHGPSEARNIIKNYECKRPFNIIITNYETALSELRYLGGFDWNLMVIDEAHRLKNFDSKLTAALRKRLLIKRIVLMTGTPIQNNLKELWSLLKFANSGSVRSWEEFEKEWSDLSDLKTMKDFQALVQRYILRRIKANVEKIPEKEDMIIEVEMTTLQKRFYRAIYEKNRKYLKNATYKVYQNDKLRIRKGVSLMNIGIQLRKCCNHPYLLNGIEDMVIVEVEKDTLKLKEKLKSDDNYREKFKQYKESLNQNDVVKNEYELLLYDKEKILFEKFVRSSGKLILLDKLLPKLKEENHRVLVFSQWVRVLDILHDFLTGRKYSFERIDGSTHKSERQRAIDRFNGHTETSSSATLPFVFLLSTRACGQGINLTSADTVIMFDGDWNPQNDIQALARCHRIGQTKTVRVYRLITSRSYEETMFRKANLKLGLDKAIMSRLEKKAQTNGTHHNKPMTEKETERLLKYGALILAEDDDKGDNFINESIDHILDKRTKHLKKTKDSQKEFELSKAKFVVDDVNKELDISDPDFWTKIVGVEEFDEKVFQHENILFNKRKRKNVQYNTDVTFKELMKDADDGSIFSDDGSPSDVSVADETELASTANVTKKIIPKTKPKKQKKPKQPKVLGYGNNNTYFPHTFQPFVDIDPISNFIYLAPCMGASLLIRRKHQYKFEVNYNNVLFVVKESGSYQFHPFYKYAIHEKILLLINRLQKIQTFMISESTVVLPLFYAKLLDYVVAFGSDDLSIQGKILKELKLLQIQSNISDNLLQNELVAIIKAAAIFVFIIVKNYKTFNSATFNKETIDLTDSKQTSDHRQALLPRGFFSSIKDEKRNLFKNFDLYIPVVVDASEIRENLLILGFRHIAGIFPLAGKEKVVSPIYYGWLLSVSFDILWNVEKKYTMQKRQEYVSKTAKSAMFR